MVSNDFKNMRARLNRYQVIEGRISWLTDRRRRYSDPEDLQELETRISNTNDQAKRVRSEILDLINLLDNPKEIDVLTSYFLDGQPIDTIADRLGHCKRHIQRLYSAGINHIIERSSD